jgi:predicted ATPase
MLKARRDLPAGTVTFLFTDIEGSTRLLHELGVEAYAEALAEHRRVLRDAFAGHGGVEVDTQGDAFFIAFPTAPGAVLAAAEAQEALADGPISVRMGLHTGEPHVTDEGYVGEVVHEGARIAATGHGGQVLLSASTRELVDMEVTDLGEHRLKDIEAPVAIYQLGPGRFPPLKTISNTNLPRPASSFVGREREVLEVASLLQDGARLLTLTGPGGTGKTRLAIEAASELVAMFKAGVFWVGLAPLRDPSLVVEEIARTLGATDDLVSHIGKREILLVLDNLEQVIQAAPELATLVETCPNLRLLVTSRELLRVRGEVGYAVAPLADPDAIELFCSRAGGERDETVRELCRALDNLPLAIELAAARTSVLSPGQILERLSGRLDLLKGGRDADPRQATLRATIAWSYELLDPQEQRLFAALSVFAGCTLETAEEVTGADLDGLQSLIDKSLLRQTENRFWMLETIRGFALERLEAGGEADEIRRRHAEHFLELAEEAEPHLRQEDDEWLDRLEAEHDNVRAALERFEAAGEQELELRLCAAFWRLWSLRGPLVEGLRRLERALGHDPRPTAARADALTGAFDLMGDQGDYVASHALGEEALAIHRALGNDWGVAYVQMGLGLLLNLEDRFAEAKPLLEDSVRGFRALGDEHWEMQTSRRLAWTYEALGDRRRAREITEGNLRRAEASGDALVQARSLAVLAQYDLDEGRVESALPLLAGAHRIQGSRRGIAYRYWDAILVCRLALGLALKGEAVAAVRLLACADVRFEELEVGAEPWVVRMNEQTLEMARSSVDEATAAAATEEGRKLTVDEAVELALATLTRTGAADQPSTIVDSNSGK